MNAQELLLQRQSTPKLIAPAPSSNELTFMLNAGMRVPDHGALTPWFFTVVENQGLDKLSQIFEKAAIEQGANDVKILKAKSMPYRAPLIIVISTQYKLHDKVPQLEQTVAAGCAAHAMQMAAFSLGFGGMWRTGDFSYNSSVKQALSINEEEDIVGFLYIGTPEKNLPLKPVKTFEHNVSYL
jgi:nitroreductase